MERRGLISQFVPICFKIKVLGTLLALSVSLLSNGQEMKVASYETAGAESNIITIKEIGGDKIDYERLTEIKGNIRNRETENLSFCLINYTGKKVYSADISAIDGDLDNKVEDFIMLMPDKLPEGQYHLVIFTDSKNNQRKENERYRFVISL